MGNHRIIVPADRVARRCCVLCFLRLLPRAYGMRMHEGRVHRYKTLAPPAHSPLPNPNPAQDSRPSLCSHTTNHRGCAPSFNVQPDTGSRMMLLRPLRKQPPYCFSRMPCIASPALVGGCAGSCCSVSSTLQLM